MKVQVVGRLLDLIIPVSYTLHHPGEKFSKLLYPVQPVLQGLQNELEITVVTNPFANELIVDLRTEKSGFAQVRLIDLAGIPIQEQGYPH